MQSKVNTPEVKNFDDLETKLEELYPKIQRYSQFLAQSNWDSEDLTQEALLKLWDHYRHTSEVSSALLNKMAYNKWIDTLRKKSREVIVEEQDELANIKNDEIHHRMDIINILTSKLTPKQAVIFTLKESVRFQHAEIALILKSSEEAIKASIYRSKQKLDKERQSLDEASDTDHFWVQNERELLSDLFYESFLKQDPTTLIKSIPFIPSLRENVTTLKNTKKTARPHHTLSSTVYMAA